MKLQGVVPVVTTGVSVVLLAGLAWWQLRGWPMPALAVGGAVLGLYVAWMLGEGKVIVREVSHEETSRDRGTFELYAAARAATVLCALALPTGSGPAGALAGPIAGGVVLVLGVAFRLWAIRTLGRFYSHRVRQQEGHQIVQSGPYRLLRHPSYTGMLVANAGLVTCFFNWFALAALVLLFVPAVARRILVEEKMLFEIEGYPEFAQRRWRLLPFVW